MRDAEPAIGESAGLARWSFADLVGEPSSPSAAVSLPSYVGRDARFSGPVVLPPLPRGESAPRIRAGAHRREPRHQTHGFAASFGRLRSLRIASSVAAVFNVSA